ncbi:MAG: glutathione S-transferase family protein [Alphaproteobacteria bacterium]|nr:glutathione S-transferase family protein [Alphaproteobacteria bacterium]
MTGRLTIYGDRISGNCLKVKWVARHAGVNFDWIDVSVAMGETQTDEFRQLNPFGQAPVVVFPDGRSLAQSNAIIFAIADMSSSRLIPLDGFARAEMLAWMFWEQYSHEPAIAVRRYRKAILRRTDAELDPALLEKGERALTHLEQTFRGPFLLGEEASLADVAIVAYTRVADEGGFDLASRPRTRAWISRVERAFDIPETEGRA